MIGFIPITIYYFKKPRANYKNEIAAQQSILNETKAQIQNQQAVRTAIINEIKDKEKEKSQLIERTNELITSLNSLKETANKARDDYKSVNRKKVRMSDGEFRIKLKAEAHIDEIAKTSVKESRKNAEDKKSHRFAEDGFSYRTAYFEDFDGEIYKLRLSIGHTG